MQLGNQVRRLGKMKGAARNKENMVGLHHPVLGRDGGPFHEGQQVALHTLARDIGSDRLAEIAWSVNEKTENIGARRLYTVMEKLLEEISFEAGKRSGETLRIDAAFVDAKLKELAQSEDLARYVL